MTRTYTQAEVDALLETVIEQADTIEQLRADASAASDREALHQMALRQAGDEIRRLGAVTRQYRSRAIAKGLVAGVVAWCAMDLLGRILG